MKIAALALSTVLLCSTGAFAQTSSPATSPDNGSSMSSTQPGTTNGNAMQNNATPNPNGAMPMDNGYRHHRGHGGWGLWGLLGLFGLFGLGGGRRNREDVVATTTTRPR